METDTIKNKSLVKITDNGVEFTSHLDGSKHFFTPEKVIQIQLDLGSDIIMPLDYCPSGKASKVEIERAVKITINWAKRSKKYFDKKVIGDQLSVISNNPKPETRNPKINQPALFGIIQGGLDPKLRKYCTKELIKLNFDGYSVGGLAVDHETRNMWSTVKLMGEMLPADKPRYLMGVGTPDDIIKATHLGMDMFDCVLPTRLARHGSVYIKNKKLKIKDKGQQCVIARKPIDRLTKQSSVRVIPSEVDEFQQFNNVTIEQSNNEYILINLLNSKFRTDGAIIDNDCRCPACDGGFSRAYISHLIRENEMLGLRLATLHNLFQYLELMKNLAKNA